MSSRETGRAEILNSAKMFSASTQNKRKLTTYGKAGRQQSYGFKSFLEQSPEKRQGKDVLQSVRDDQVSGGRPRQTTKMSWDLPSDDEPLSRVQPLHSQAAGDDELY